MKFKDVTMLLKKLLSLCLMIITMASAQIPPHNQTIPTANPEENKLVNTLATPIIVASLALVLWITAPDDVKASLRTQCHPGNLTTNFLKEYTTWALVTLSHEIGHALTHRLLTGNPSTIHLGSSAPDSTPLVTLGALSIDGLNPKTGRTQCSLVNPDQFDVIIGPFLQTYCEQHHLIRQNLTLTQIYYILQSKEFETFKQKQDLPANKKALFLLAGGLSGLLTYHLTQLCITKGIRLDHISYAQLICALIPTSNQSDGAQLWRDCLGIPQKHIDTAIALSPFIAMAAEVLCSVTSPANKKAPLHSTLLLGLINYFMQGYLRFHC